MKNKTFGFIKKIRKNILLFFNKFGSNTRKKELKNEKITIISNNCFAGVTYEYLNLPYYSPTIGLYFFAEEYIKFLKKFKYYVTLPLEEVDINVSKYKDELIKLKQENVVLGKIGDVEIVFLHYLNFEDAKKKWEKRCKRINYDNIIFKFNDQNLCTEQHLKEFNNLKLKNKICFTAKKYDYMDFYQIKRDRKRNCVKDDVFRYHKYFNIVKYINNKFGKKKILHLLYSSNFSGAENVACTIIENLNKQHEMYYCSPSGTIDSILISKNIKSIKLEKFNYFEVKKAIKKIKPDIIHAHDFRASVIASLMPNSRYVVSQIHKNDSSMNKISIKSLLFLFATLKFKKIVGVSDSVLEEFIFSKFIRKKYVTVMNYVDKTNVIKKSKEITVNDKFDLFYFGRLQYEKNPLEFIEIVNVIKKNNNNVKAVMIGDGPMEKNCRELINKYKLNNNIEMVGYKSNPFPWIASAKVGIMPSKYEGFGLTAIESSILDKKVLNSGVGGLRYIYRNNPEYICNSTEEYIKKINECDRYDTLDVSEFIDKKCWISKIENIYGENL